MVSTKKLVDTMLLQTDYPINVEPPDGYKLESNPNHEGDWT